MDERQYSRPLDVHRICEHPVVQKVIQVLFGELKSNDHLGKSPQKKILKHLKAVVLDLYVAYLSDPLLYVAYPRSKDKYSKETLKHLNKLKHHACYNEMLKLIGYSKVRKK